MTEAGEVNVGLTNINVGFSGQVYLPYSMGLMVSYAQRHLPGVEKFRFGTPLFKRQSVESCLGALKGSDIVFLSQSIWNEALNAEVARRIKEEQPETLVVFGGNSVPPVSRIGPYFQKHPYVDIAAHGEGERVFNDILGAFSKRDWGNVRSISFRDKGEVISTAPGERIMKLDDIPSPYLNGFLKDVMDKNPGEGWIALWETNRGCPYTCAYCSWGGEVGKKVGKFEDQRLLEEIDWFTQEKIQFVRCCDANFGIMPRDLGLVQRLAENKQKTGFPHAVSVENAKNATETTYKVQKLLNDSGLSKGVNLAVQTRNEEVLLTIRRKNIDNRGYQELQTRFARDGIPTFSDFIIGLPGETYESFANGIEDLIEGGQHNSISLYNALILPNAEMGDPAYQTRHGIRTRHIRQISGYQEVDDERPYETEEIIVETNTMSTEDWRRKKRFAWLSAMLHHGKLLQIPFVLAHQTTGIGYRALIEAFCEPDVHSTPLLAENGKFIVEKTRAMLEEGSPNNSAIPDKLNMWWPIDQYLAINMCRRGKLEQFYDEAQTLITQKVGNEAAEVVCDAITLNRALYKQPFLAGKGRVSLDHNVWEVYRGVILDQPVPLREGKHTYEINREGEGNSWNSWEDWARENLWWGHKKKRLLYEPELIQGPENEAYD